MNAKSMLKKALADMGADSLWYGDGEETCGCGIDDLAPCDCLNLDGCIAAKQGKGGLFYPMEVA